MRSPRPMDAAERGAWEAAETLWGVSVHDPVMASGTNEGSFAWFSFPPQVTVDLGKAAASGIDQFLESVFAHEIGHHVLSPSTRLASLKITHQMARAIQASDSVATQGMAAKAHNLSNLWSDMLINVRVAELQRRRDLRSAPPISPRPHLPEMVRMWQVLSASSVAGPLWWVIYRAYEIIWVLPPGSLCPAAPPMQRQPAPAPALDVAASRRVQPPRADDAVSGVQRAELARAAEVAEAIAAAQEELDTLVRSDALLDASLLAETVKTFGDDPISGALRFGMLMAPYVLDKGAVPEKKHAVRGAYCGGETGDGPATAAEMVAVLGDARLDELPEHPAITKARRAVTAAHAAEGAGGADGAATLQPGSAGQGYGLAATLALYEGSDDNDVIAAWYQTRARRWVRPLRQAAPATAGTEDEIPGPVADWGLGDELSDIDWPATLGQSAVVIPGVTTRRRDLLDDPPPTRRTSVDLDLYIDSSGSMRSPLAESPAVLAGTILILSVLRGGGRVRVTSFSAAGQVAGGERFTRKAVEAMRYLTVYFGGGTTFPLDVYGDRYRTARSGPDIIRRHVVVLSDEGLASMFGQGQPEFAGVAARVRRMLDTGTLVLQDHSRSVAAPAAAAGYTVDYIASMDDAPGACAQLARRILSPAPQVGALRAGAVSGGPHG